MLCPQLPCRIIFVYPSNATSLSCKKHRSHTDVETNIYAHSHPHVRLLLHPSNTYQNPLTHTQIQPNLQCAATPPPLPLASLPVTLPLPPADAASAFSDGTLLLALGSVIVAVCTTALLTIGEQRTDRQHGGLELQELLISKSIQCFCDRVSFYACCDVWCLCDFWGLRDDMLFICAAIKSPRCYYDAGSTIEDGTPSTLMSGHGETSRTWLSLIRYQPRSPTIRRGYFRSLVSMRTSWLKDLPTWPASWTWISSCQIENQRHWGCMTDEVQSHYQACFANCRANMRVVMFAIRKSWLDLTSDGIPNIVTKVDWIVCVMPWLIWSQSSIEMLASQGIAW
jgi:hypothetical protein